VAVRSAITSLSLSLLLAVEIVSRPCWCIIRRQGKSAALVKWSSCSRSLPVTSILVGWWQLQPVYVRSVLCIQINVSSATLALNHEIGLVPKSSLRNSIPIQLFKNWPWIIGRKIKVFKDPKIAVNLIDRTDWTLLKAPFMYLTL
jgi:hypothetical protein